MLILRLATLNVWYLTLSAEQRKFIAMEETAKNKNAPVSLHIWAILNQSLRPHTRWLFLHSVQTYISTVKTCMWTIWTICDGDLLSRLMLSTVCVCPPPIKLFPRHTRSCQPLSGEHRWEEQLNLRGPCAELKQKIINKWENVSEGLENIKWDTCFHSSDMVTDKEGRPPSAEQDLSTGHIMTDTVICLLQDETETNSHL